MDISIPDHNLLDDGEHNLLDFDCKDFDDDVGISHSILNGDKQSPGSFAGEVLQDIFAHTEETFGGSAHMWHNHLIHEADGDANKQKRRAPQPQTSKDSHLTTQHKMKEEEVSLATARGDADGDLHEEASSLLGENTDDDLPPGDRREKRRRSNRESARRGRQRRMHQLGTLETEVQELHQQHTLLLNKLAEAGDLLNSASRENRIYKTIASYLGSDQPELVKALNEANAAEAQKDRMANEISDEEAEAIAAAALATNENNPTKALMDLLNLAIQRNNMVV